jgi:hypothetical protein
MEMVMSSYHLTQEQAWKLWMIICENNPSQTLDEALKDFANAVLDKVLGEPVAFIDGKDVILANEGLYLGNDTLLYAPKKHKSI